MKKLTLKLDDLRIDSFQTTPREPGKGTVFGEQCTCWTNCTCPGCPTCDASCGGTCDASCNGTCAGDTCDGCCCGPSGVYTCDYSCDCVVTETQPTSPGPMQECMICW